jgi:hypothetical protein
MRCDMEQRDCIPAGIAAMFETSPKPLIDIPKPASPSDIATIVRFEEASVMVGTEKLEKAVLETIGADEEVVEAVRCVTFFIVWLSMEASLLFAIAETEICGGGGGGLAR